VLVGRLRHRYSVGGIVDLDEDVIAEGRIAERRRPRLDHEAVGVEVGQVERQVCAAGTRRMRHLGRVEGTGKPVDQANLQLIALLQSQPDTAVIRCRGRPRRALVPGRRRPRADLIDPAGRVHDRVAGRRIGNTRHRLRHGDHQEIEDTARTRKYRWVDEVRGACDVRTAQEGGGDGCQAHRQAVGASRPWNDEWHGFAHGIAKGDGTSNDCRCAGDDDDESLSALRRHSRDHA
jgi:hypothetical protein